MKKIVDLIKAKYGKENVIEIISEEHATKALNRESGERILITLPYLDAKMSQDNHALVYNHIVQILQKIDRNEETKLISEMYKMQDKAIILLNDIKNFIAESRAISVDVGVEITPAYNTYNSWSGYTFVIAYKI